MSLEIFKKYVAYYKSENVGVMAKISHFFTSKNPSNEVGNDEFWVLLNKENFEDSFSKFLKNNYSLSEINDYSILFSLLHLSVVQNMKLSLVFSSFQLNKHRDIGEFLSRNDQFEKDHNLDGLLKYIHDEKAIKDSWNRLIVKHEPGLLIALATMGERVNYLMELQSNKLTNDDINLLRKANDILKTYWITSYLNQQKNAKLHHSINYHSLSDYLDYNPDLKPSMEMLMKYIEFNGVVENNGNIKLLRDFVRNLELYKIAKSNNPIYLNAEHKFDKNYPKYSVFMNAKWKIVEELIYLDQKSIGNNNSVVKKMIKF